MRERVMDTRVFRGVWYGLSSHYVVGAKIRIQKEGVRRRRGQQVKNNTKKYRNCRSNKGKRHLGETEMLLGGYDLEQME